MTAESGQRRAKRRTWIVAGAAMIAASVVGMAGQSVGWAGVIGWAGVGLYAAALVLFAVGFTASGSVVGRRSVGAVAMVALAAWIVVAPIAPFLLAPAAPGESPVFGIVDALTRFVLAATVVVCIGRAGLVPAPWCWAPAWTLATVSVSWVVGEVIGPRAEASVVAGWLAADSLVRLAANVFLGVLAIILAERASVRTVVFASRDDR